MVEIFTEWNREDRRRPFHAEAWNRLVRWLSGYAAGPLLLVDETGADLLESDAAAAAVILAGIGTFSSAGGMVLGANLTFTGTGRRILADLSNATTANRLLIQSSTNPGATDLGLIPNGTSAVAALSVFNNSTPASATVQAMIRVNALAMQVRSESPAASYLPMQFLTSGVVGMTLETTGILTESYGVRLANAVYLLGRNAANSADVNLIRLNASDIIELGASGTRLSALSPLTNNTPIYGRNAANSASVALVNLNASDIMETGATGTRHNLLGTVVAPAIDPPTVNGQVAAGAVAAAWAHFTVSGGAVTLRDSYNVTSATYNAAGDYTVAWDRDFSTAYYACLPSVEDNGAILLAPKVNSQAAGSADIWVYNATATKTDPDAVSVVCFGQLS